MATTLEDIESRLDDINKFLEDQADTVNELDKKLKSIVKASFILSEAMVKVSDNMIKVGAGNVNAQHLRDLIFKQLNIKTGWAKAEVKSMINTIFGTLMGK